MSRRAAVILFAAMPLLLAYAIIGLNTTWLPEAWPTWGIAVAGVWTCCGLAAMAWPKRRD
ncbi:hypothetical protein ACQPZJ_01670 [Actinoplanes sp. CA-054009]